MVCVIVFAFVACNPESAADGGDTSKSVTITMKANEGVGDDVVLSVDANTSVALTEGSFTKEGMMFLGWNTKADYSGEPYADCSTVTPTTDLTLYAQWVDEGTFTVDENGVLDGGPFLSGELPQNLALPRSIGGVTVTETSENLLYGISDDGGLLSVALPDTITTLGATTFMSCNVLETVKLPSALTTIGTSCFSSCSKLKNITIPETVIEIKHNAFSMCYELESLTLPASLTTMYENTFSLCPAIITLDSDNTTYVQEDGMIFDAAKTTLYYNSSTGFEITIPENVTKIAAQAFCYSPLTIVNIPSTVTEVGDYAFYNCSNLKVVRVYAENPPTVGYSTFTNTKLTRYNDDSEGYIVVPKASTSLYGDAENWKCFKMYYLTE